MSFDEQLLAIDAEALTPPVRRALGSRSAVVLDWHSQPLAGGMGAVMGAALLHRFSGTANDGGVVRPWTLVLKILRAPTADATFYNQPDPAHPSYWKREALLYGSGLLDALPTGFAAPRCYAVVEHVGGIWLWLEEIVDRYGSRWPVAAYGAAARHLGRFNGAYLAGRPLPDQPWLSRDYLRPRAERNAPSWDRFAAWRGHPNIRRAWPGDLIDRVHRLWQERHRFLDALDRLPRTFCHNDADRRNLFARRAPDGTDETVAIDWAFAGIGAVGEDLPSLIVASAFRGLDIDLPDLPGLSRRCFDGYLAGLKEAGWTGDDQVVRFGYSAALALHYGPFWGAAEVALAGATVQDRWAAAFGRPLDDLLDRHAVLQLFVMDQADLARKLLDTV